jgi:hypothetical protein
MCVVVGKLLGGVYVERMGGMPASKPCVSEWMSLGYFRERFVRISMSFQAAVCKGENSLHFLSMRAMLGAMVNLSASGAFVSEVMGDTATTCGQLPVCA